jgi:hypothetical protein
VLWLLINTSYCKAVVSLRIRYQIVCRNSRNILETRPHSHCCHIATRAGPVSHSDDNSPPLPARNTWYRKQLTVKGQRSCAPRRSKRPCASQFGICLERLKKSKRISAKVAGVPAEIRIQVSSERQRVPIPCPGAAENRGEVLTPCGLGR